MPTETTPKSGWDILKENFRVLMEETIGNYHNANVIDITKKSGLPASVWDFGYTLQYFGMPKPKEFINQEIYVNYNVRLQVSYELNEHDELDDYDSTISEIENIVVQRLDATTWQNDPEAQGTIVNIEHQTTSPFTFISNSSSDERFGVVNIDFLVTVEKLF